MTNAQSLSGKVAVITGASRGIGRTLAQMFADAGADLVLMARTSAQRPSRFPGTVEETAEECRQRGAHVAIAPGDVARLEDVQQAAAVTEHQFGRCDILVNNAAINPIGSVAELPVRLFQRGFEVNVFGPFMMTQAFLPLLRRSPGSWIINISSGAARDDRAGWSTYSASKAALDRLSLTLAKELRPEGIRVVDLQLELSVVTEGYVFNRPDADISGWEQPQIMGEAALWIMRHGERYHGRVVTIGELRQDYAAAGLG